MLTLNWRCLLLRFLFLLTFYIFDINFWVFSTFLNILDVSFVFSGVCFVLQSQYLFLSIAEYSPLKFVDIEMTDIFGTCFVISLLHFQFILSCVALKIFWKDLFLFVNLFYTQYSSSLDSIYWRSALNNAKIYFHFK